MTRGGLLALIVLIAAGCGGGGGGVDSAAVPSATVAPPPAPQPPPQPPPAPAMPTSATRGFAAGTPWASYYGAAAAVDLAQLARTFRVIDIDADPATGNFTAAQITQLKNGGANKVLSYFNLGACEHFRDYWRTAPTGVLSCSANLTAQRGPYQGYADETWMNPGDPAYQQLLLDVVAPRLVAQGVDGFYFDNLEIVEHGSATGNGPCDAACSQGGLDLVARLRAKYPQLLFVMQNATSDITRSGVTGGVAFASLLDGVAHEEVYAPVYDATVESQLVSWAGLNLRPGGQPFWIATLDYVGTCTNLAGASAAYQRSRARGFVPYASDASARQGTVCYWGL